MWGGQLASASNPAFAENLLTLRLDADQSYWLGLTLADEQWRWLDGEKFDHHLWTGRHYFNWDSSLSDTKVNECGALAGGNETFF